jgi:hypothetical protein
MEINTMEDIQTTIKEFILNEFLPGEDPNELTDTTPLSILWNPFANYSNCLFDEHPYVDRL